MKNCLDEGTLRAYLDGELDEAQSGHTGGHLAHCTACRARLDHMQAALRSVHELLGVLSPADVVAMLRARRNWHWVAGSLAAGLAAAIALFLTAGKPVPKLVPSVAKAETAVLRPPIIPATQPPKTVRRHRRRPVAAPAPEFVRLAGADPMQVGMVVRVTVPLSAQSLDGSVQEIAADLLIGEDGRARAIRFLE